MTIFGAEWTGQQNDPAIACKTALLLSRRAPATIEGVTPEIPLGTAPFAPGTIVLITLNSPREKFWGAVLDITAAGVSVRGVDLNSFDEVTGMLRAEEPVLPATVFFPLNRVERIELELTNGPIPSLSDRFISKSGRRVENFLGLPDPEMPF